MGKSERVDGQKCFLTAGGSADLPMFNYNVLIVLKFNNLRITHIHDQNIFLNLSLKNGELRVT